MSLSSFSDGRRGGPVSPRGRPGLRLQLARPTVRQSPIHLPADTTTGTTTYGRPPSSFVLAAAVWARRAWPVATTALYFIVTNLKGQRLTKGGLQGVNLASRRAIKWKNLQSSVLAPVVEGCFYSCSSCSKTSKLKSDDLDENRSCWDVFFLFMTPRRITCTSNNSSLLRAVCGFLWVQTNPYKIDKEEGFTHFWRS